MISLMPCWSWYSDFQARSWQGEWLCGFHLWFNVIRHLKLYHGMTRTRRYELTLLFCYCCCRDETSDSEMTKLRLRDTKEWQAQLRSCVYKRDGTRRCRCVIPLPPIQLCHRSLLPLLSMSFTCPYQNSIWLTLSELVCDVHIGIFEGLGTVSPSIFLVWFCLLAQISNNWTSNKHVMALET